LWQVWLALGAGHAPAGLAAAVNVKSLNTALLREAGRETQSVAGFGRELLELDKPGPAALVLETAKKVGDPAPVPLDTVYQDFARKHREMMPWGGWDIASNLCSGRTRQRPRIADRC